MDEFRRRAKLKGVCEATTEVIASSSKATEANYDNVINQLRKTPDARVVVCFCEGQTITGLLNATRRLGVAGELLFLGRSLMHSIAPSVSNIILLYK